MTTQTAESRWLAQLHDLALDLRWSRRPEIRAFFRAIDPNRARTGADDPWAILRLAPTERLEELATDPARAAFLELEGRIRPAPPGLLQDLLRNEPGD